MPGKTWNDREPKESDWTYCYSVLLFGAICACWKRLPYPSSFLLREMSIALRVVGPMLRFIRSGLFLKLTAVGILAGVAFVAGAWSTFTVIGTPTRKPTTCKELAERLRGQGLSIEWEIYQDQAGMPSMVVFDYANDHLRDARKGHCNRVRKHGLEWLKEGHTDCVIITQYPTEELAEEQAASEQNAWSYGRFVVWGLPGRFREQVKANLL